MLAAFRSSCISALHLMWTRHVVVPWQYIYASRDRADEVMDRQRAVRDERFRYIRSWYPEWPEAERLYIDPVSVPAGNKIEARAACYSWKESDIVTAH